MDTYTAAMIVEGVEEVETAEQYIAAAGHLVQTGDAWRLQGFFGRTCSALIEEGYLTRDGQPTGQLPEGD